MRVVAQMDPAVYGFEQVQLLDEQSFGDSTPYAEGIPELAGVVSRCNLHFTITSGPGGEVVNVAIVPGGAISFQTAVEAENSQPVTVDGAEAAVVATGLDRYEGSGAMIVATDGVNILMVTPDMETETAKAAPIASAVLAMLQGQ